MTNTVLKELRTEVVQAAQEALETSSISSAEAEEVAVATKRRESNQLSTR